MRAAFLPYEANFDAETASWCLIGRDSRGGEFGVGVGDTIEAAESRLRDWLLDSLVASAGDGDDRFADLVHTPPLRRFLTLMPVDLIPIRLRLLRSRHGLTQGEVAERLGMTQQGYAKLERPGTNLQLRTIQQVEAALDEELLQLA